MVEQAKKDLNIDMARSWMVGDMTMDALMAKRAGLRFVGVRTGHACADGKYADQLDMAALELTDDLAGAVASILKN